MDNSLLGLAAAAVAIGGATLYLVLASGNKRKGPIFLNKERQVVPLKEKIQLSHDTFLYRFALPQENSVLGLPVGKHFKIFSPNAVGSVKGQWNGQPDPEDGKAEIERKYTPTSSDDDLGHFDLVIKVYRKGTAYSPPRDRFPDGGKMSQHVDSLRVGDVLHVQGPFGLIEYKGRGVFEVSRKELPRVTKVGMVAGGTGITPMLQIMTAILKDAGDATAISLLFANQTEEDILLRSMLEDLQARHPKRLKVHYTLDRPPAGWLGQTGFITEKMLRDTLPPADSDAVVLMCGPPVMVDRAVRPNLEAMGYGKAQMLVF